MSPVTRRRFLKGTAASVAWGWALSRCPRPGRAGISSRKPRVVIAGASFAGISLAHALVRAAPGADVLLLDRSALFVFAPMQLRYAFGRLSLEQIARPLALLEARGLSVVQAAITGVDRDRRRVITTAGAADYDHLVLATGMRLATEAIPGLAGEPGANVGPYDRSGLLELRGRIADFREGHVLIATPNGPYTCQPAPYEYALMWAAHIERRGLKARVTLLDPRSRPTPPAIADGLTEAMDAHEGVLAYEPFTQIRSIDPRARVAETDAGRLSYDLLSVIPPNRTMSFIGEAGLGEPFVDVDPRTFRSVRDERIWALGDNADTPYAKTAYTAMDSARLAAATIGRAIGAKPPEAALPANRCYPMVDAARALYIEAHWALEEDSAGAINVKVGGRHDDRARASYARLRRQWERRALSTLFGS